MLLLTKALMEHGLCKIFFIFLEKNFFIIIILLAN